MELPSITKTFTVKRQEPELVVPARPTPTETRHLSDIDDQEGLRFPMTFIHFYKSRDAKEDDPAKIIRAALAEALVAYYPFAGRLRELPDKKLVVECTGEGVLFVEADADVTMEELGEDIHPPFPCLDELLFDVPDSNGILNCPLLTIQVTRLRCGGFIFALNLNHTMADSIGLVQFENAIAEIARGDSDVPSVTPVWRRELLNARDPPAETCTHREFIPVSNNTKRTIFPFNPREFVHKSFYFGPEDIAALRSSLPSDLKCSSFDVLIACLWRCRTIALEFDPDEEVRTLYFINARSRFNPPLPEGFYGNAIASPPVITTAGELINNPLSYVVELVRKPKTEVTEEYMKSLAGLMVLRGRPRLNLVSTYMVSDLTRIGFDDVDFGWGKPTYAGAARAAAELIPGVATYCTPTMNKEGQRGIVVPVCLPKLAMEKFAKEINLMLRKNI